MIESLRITQAGLALGTAGRSRSDGVNTDVGGGVAATVTLQDTLPQTTSTWELLSVPPGDDVAVGSMAPSGHNCTFTPKAGVVGSYRIQLTQDAGLGTQEIEVRTFSFRSENLGLRLPAHNEKADPDATIANAATRIDESETNEGDSSQGWHPSEVELYEAVDLGVRVRKAGTLIGSRPTINVIDGTNVVATVADNPGAKRVDVTIATTAAAVGSTAPADVTKAAAAAGASAEASRADHKHDVSTATVTSTASANAEGTATSLARSDHVHRTGLTVRKASGADIGSRPRLNFTEGANVTLTITDDGVGDEIDIDIAAAGGATPSLQTVYESGGDNDVPITTADGAIILRNSADTTNLLELRRTFAGAGKSLLIDHGASVTGDALDVTIAGTGKALSLNHTGTQAEGVGAIEITKSGGGSAMRVTVPNGSATHVGLDVVVGSCAAVAMRAVTYGTGDVLQAIVGGDKTILQITSTGAVTLKGGPADPGKTVSIAGGDAASGNNNGGNVTINAGNKSGTGVIGTVSIGTTRASAVNIGSKTESAVTIKAVSIPTVEVAEVTDGIAFTPTFAIVGSFGDAWVITCNGNPHGNISDPPKGSIAIDVSGAKLWQKDAASPSTNWHEIGAGGGVGIMASAKLSSARQLPSNTTENWFEVDVGHVMLHAIFMQVVTALGATTTSVKFKSDGPGTSATDWNSSGVDMNAWAVGRAWSVLGDGTTNDSSGVAGISALLAPAIALLDTIIQVSNTNQPTGTVNAWVVYTPLETGAVVTPQY